MALPNENIQDQFFYSLMWPKSVTESLVSFLLTQKQVGAWVWNSNNGPSIIEARLYLNSTFHTDYTDIEVLGRVKKLRARFNLFTHMISSSGVGWNKEQNFMYASEQQWKAWREVYPLSRAYTTQGEPLLDELKELFSPDDPEVDDDIIIIVDSDEEEIPLFHEEIVQAVPIVGDDIVIISSDDDSFEGLFGFDSESDFSFLDVDDFLTDSSVDTVVGEIVDQMGYEDGNNSEEEVRSPTMRVPTISVSWNHLSETWHEHHTPTLRDGFTTSDSKSE
ncbi:hypothetical protein ACS0TY_035326 [Phlomoides rotata]